MKSTLYALINFVSLSLVLIVPGLLGAPVYYTIALSALIVGMQAAQSTVVQSNITRLPFGRHYRWSAVLVLTIAAVVTLSPESSGHLVGVVALTFGGAVFGLSIGKDALYVLAKNGAKAYQKSMARRSAILLFSASVGSVINGFEILVVVVLFGSYVMFSSVARDISESPKISFPLVGTAVLGLAGSLFYRNDITWFRAATSALPDFQLWNLYLVVYSGAQAIIGILVVQFIFSDRERWVLLLKKQASLISKLSYMVLFLAVCCCYVLYVYPDAVLLAMCLSLFLITLTSLISGLSHAWSRSWAPYSAGIIGTSVLIAGLSYLSEPGQALVLANAVTLGVVLLGPITLASKK